MAEVEIKPEFREKILAGRKAVGAYRTAHAQLCSGVTLCKR